MIVDAYKKWLDVANLLYVSENIQALLGIDIQNKGEAFRTTIDYRSSQESGGYRVILYIRLSEEDEDIIDKDVSRSIRNQLMMLLVECEKRNWIVVAIFCEDGITGTDDNRPEWRKALKFCEFRNTEIVLCKSQSRFSRSMEMIEKYLHKEFVAWNIRFVGLVDSTDTSVIGNKKARQINGLVNEWQVEDQSINIRDTLKTMQKQGLFTGGFAPFGYKKNSKDMYQLTIDKPAAKIIKKIFSMYANGNGAAKICKYLNDKSIPTPSTYKYESGSNFTTPLARPNKRTLWHPSTIYNLLKDEVYIGTLVQHKSERISYKDRRRREVPKEQRIIVPHCHSAIIDKETWNIVSSRFAEFKKSRPTSKGEVSLFSGKIKCEICNHTFYRNSSHEERGYVYWVCGKRADDLCNNKHGVPEKDMTGFILEQINNQIGKYYDKALVKKNYHEQKTSPTIEDEMMALKKEKKDVVSRILRKENVLAIAYEDRVNGIIDVNEFLIIKNKHSMDIDNYKKRLTRNK